MIDGLLSSLEYIVIHVIPMKFHIVQNAEAS